jgi:hypothetical protein
MLTLGSDDTAGLSWQTVGEVSEMSRTLFYLGLLLPAAASGQAMVEAAMGAGRAATMAAPAKSMGKSVSGIAGSLDKALGSSDAAKAHEKTSTTVVTNSAKAAEATAQSAATITIREDADGIEEGIAYEDLIERFGKPVMSITVAGDQTLTYKGIAGLYRVTIHGGKVASIVPPPAPRQPY